MPDVAPIMLIISDIQKNVAQTMSTAWKNVFLLGLVSELNAHTNIITIFTQGPHSIKKVIIQSPGVICSRSL